MTSSLNGPSARRGLTLLALAAVVFSAPLLEAQTTLANPEAYQRAKRAATATFLDRRRPTAERLEAAKNLRYPDNATFAAMIRIGIDRTQDDAVRREALRRHRYDDRYLDAVLRILNDASDGGPDLDAALVEDVSRRTTFRLPAQIRQRVQNSLRRLLDDRRDPVRLQAYRALVAMHDTIAIERIAESLRTGQGFPVPLPEAINLLDLDGSAKHIVALRPYLTNTDPLVQAQAARALALDPQSRPRIVELARSPRTPRETRLQALRALSREDGQFADYAVGLVQDTKEDPAVRQAAMKSFAGRMNYQKVSPADQIRFAQAVDKLATDRTITTGDGGKIREEAQQLHLYLRKAFPEVQKHYEGR
jgi:hypothetical protein